MGKILKSFILSLLILFAVSFISCSDKSNSIYGKWKVVKKESTVIVTWAAIELDIEKESGKIAFTKTWSRGKGSYTEAYSVTPEGEPASIKIGRDNWSEERYMEINWPENRFMGVRIKENTEKQFKAEWLTEDKAIKLTSNIELQVSQGTVKVETVSEYKLDETGNRLTVTEKRSTRPESSTYVFERIVE